MNERILKRLSLVVTASTLLISTALTTAQAQEEELGQPYSISARYSLEELDLQWANPWYPGDPNAPAEHADRPGPFETAEEHYRALFDEADGGTQHTMETIPDWSGIWHIHDVPGELDLVARGIDREGLRTRLVPEYQELYDWDRSRWADGTAIDPLSFCLGASFPRYYSEYGFRTNINSPTLSLHTSEMDNQIRYIFTDGRDMPPDDYIIPTRLGQSVGFWDEDILVVWTKGLQDSILQRNHTRVSGELETVERIRRVSDEIMEIEITLYDPVVFSEPYVTVHKQVTVDQSTADAVALNWPTYWSCNEGTNWNFNFETGEITELSPAELPPINSPDFWFSEDNRIQGRD